MTILQIEVEDARPVAARCDDRHLSVTLADGRFFRRRFGGIRVSWRRALMAVQSLNCPRWGCIGRKLTKTSALRASCAARRRLERPNPVLRNDDAATTRRQKRTDNR